jgi:hypothetical protein
MAVIASLLGGGCIGGSQATAHTISVKPKTSGYTFQIGHGIQPGDTIRCVRARKMVETAVVPERGHGVGNGVDFAVSVRPSGKVEVNCSVLIGTP